LKTTTNQTMKIMGTNVDQKNETEFVFSWTVKDVDATKVVLEQKIESVSMKITIGSNEIKYDSTAKDAADNPLAGFFKPLVGSVFTLTLDPNKLNVTKVEGREEFVKKLSEANPQMQKVLGAILSEDQLKQMSEPAFTVVPDKGKRVKVGDAWSRTGSLKMGPIGSYDAKYDYKYAGTEKRTVDGKEATLHKIEMKTTLTYKPPDAKDAGGLPFQIKGGKLDTTEASGTIWFDADKGRTAETKMDVSLKGNLDISVGEQSANVELEQKMNTTAAASDANPNQGAPAATPAVTPAAVPPPAPPK